VFLQKYDGPIKSYFERDNFTSRRTTGNNMFDPESLLTGGEGTDGLDYDNSTRDYPSQGTYDDIVHGRVPVELVPKIAPRTLVSRY